MSPRLLPVDRVLSALPPFALLGLALAALLLVGVLDYASGFEISMSVFYLFPVTLVAWYGNRGATISLALLSSLSWYVADHLAGHDYSHPAIPVWNAAVRLSFFLICGLLLVSLRRSLQVEQRLARRDTLTGLFGRHAFIERLAHDLELSRRHARPLTLAYADLDGFKAVNDTGGHGAGDLVLQAAAQGFAQALRSADAAARLGGDEFALLLPDTDAEGAREVVARVGERFREAIGETGWPVACSLGVVTFLKPPDTAEAALHAADELMYRVKRDGKGAVAFRIVGGLQESAAAPPTTSP